MNPAFQARSHHAVLLSAINRYKCFEGTVSRTISGAVFHVGNCHWFLNKMLGKVEVQPDVTAVCRLRECRNIYKLSVKSWIVCIQLREILTITELVFWITLIWTYFWAKWVSEERISRKTIRITFRIQIVTSSFLSVNCWLCYLS